MGIDITYVHPQVAFFGCGDSLSYGASFCDAIGEMYDQFATTGATLIGKSPHPMDTMV